VSYPPANDPQQQPPTHPDQVLAQPTPVRKHSKLPWIVGGVIALLAIVGATVGVMIVITSDSEQTTKAVATQPLSAWELEQEDLAAEPGIEDEGGLTATPATDPTTGGAALSASDITLTPKVTDKQCFGSAGCSLTIKIDMSYRGADLSADDTWEVTYQVKGDESGPIIGTFEITGDQYTVNEESLSTRSSRTKVTIKVTDVEKLGI